MNKLKMFVFFTLMFLLSGCALNYELKITEDLLFEEKITVSESKKTIGEFSLNAQSFAKELKDSFTKDKAFDHYFIDIKESGPNLLGIANTTYISFDELKEKNSYTKDFFTDMNLSNDKDIITITLTANPNNMLIKGDTLEGSIIENANIKISIPFKVIDSNADDFDIETNTLTWKYNENVISKSIYMSFDASDKYKSPVPSEFYILGIVILSFVLIIGFIYYKYKSNNKF